MRKRASAMTGLISIALIAAHVAAAQDCNDNGVLDVDDITNGTSADLNGNGIPDECERCDVNEAFKLTASDAAFNDRFAFEVALDGVAALVGAPTNDSLVFDGGAAYVYRFDGSDWVEEAQLTAFDGAGLDHFGMAVALSGHIAAIGAPHDDDAGSASGSVYVFRFDGIEWVFDAKLVPGGAAAGDAFGSEVAIVGELIVVGAPGSDAAEDGAGAAYVFRFDTGAWVEQAELTASDASPGDEFGRAISLADGLLLVSAPADSDIANGAGSAYVYRLAGGVWIEEAKLTASDASAGDEFGASLVLFGNTAMIGAPNEDDDGPNAGAVYCFQYDGAGWSEQGRIAPHDLSAGDNFGEALGGDGNLLVIASPGDDEAAADAGAAYAFVFDGMNWMPLAKFTAADGETRDRFAGSVAVSESSALVAAWQNDDAGFASGSAYAFHGLSDCNGNGALDTCDIGAGLSADLNGNFVPDECDPDCNSNAIPDDLDIARMTSMDCNANGVPDECDIAEGFSADCNANGVPDECDIAGGGSSDCNANAVPDECDIAAGTSLDCDQNGVPDECQPDSDGDGVIDACDACPDTPVGVEVDAAGCPLADPVEDLALESICSDDPEVECRWQVDNPNPFDVEFEWQLDASEQQDRISAPPGESFFKTKTVAGANIVKMHWKDELRRERGVVAESAGLPCDESDADRDGVPDLDDWCPETADGDAVDEHGCGRKQKVELCHVPRGKRKNARDIRVKVSAVDAHLRHGDYLGGCEPDEHDKSGRGDREDSGDKHRGRDDREEADDKRRGRDDREDSGDKRHGRNDRDGDEPVSPAGKRDRSDRSDDDESALDDLVAPDCGAGGVGLLPLTLAGLTGLSAARRSSRKRVLSDRKM